MAARTFANAAAKPPGRAADDVADDAAPDFNGFGWGTGGQTLSDP